MIFRSGLLSLIISFALACSSAWALTVNFNNYTGETDNDFVRCFQPGGSEDFYTQYQDGGITGGALQPGLHLADNPQGGRAFLRAEAYNAPGLTHTASICFQYDATQVNAQGQAVSASIRFEHDLYARLIRFPTGLFRLLVVPSSGNQHGHLRHTGRPLVQDGFPGRQPRVEPQPGCT